MTKFILTTIIFLFGLSTLATAQDLPSPGKRANIDYVEVVLVKYKSGRGGEGNRIIREKFMPAGEAAGVPGPITLHMQTGPWDSANFWNYGDTMGNLDYFMTPNGAKFWAALAEQNGGIENARKIMADYEATIASSQSEIGHRHVPPPEEDN